MSKFNRGDRVWAKVEFQEFSIGRGEELKVIGTYLDSGGSETGCVVCPIDGTYASHTIHESWLELVPPKPPKPREHWRIQYEAQSGPLISQGDYRTKEAAEESGHGRYMEDFIRAVLFREVIESPEEQQ